MLKERDSSAVATSLHATARAPVVHLGESTTIRHSLRDLHAEAVGSSVVLKGVVLLALLHPLPEVQLSAVVLLVWSRMHIQRAIGLELRRELEQNNSTDSHVGRRALALMNFSEVAPLVFAGSQLSSLAQSRFGELAITTPFLIAAALFASLGVARLRRPPEQVTIVRIPP